MLDIVDGKGGVGLVEVESDGENGKGGVVDEEIVDDKFSADDEVSADDDVDDDGVSDDDVEGTDDDVGDDLRLVFFG